MNCHDDLTGVGLELGCSGRLADLLLACTNQNRSKILQDDNIMISCAITLKIFDILKRRVINKEVKKQQTDKNGSAIFCDIFYRQQQNDVTEEGGALQSVSK